MARITTIDFRIRATTIEAADGWRLMQGAVTNGCQIKSSPVVDRLVVHMSETQG